MDKKYFSAVCEKIINGNRNKNGIGTLGEKNLHHILKHYLEPDTSKHETKIGSFVADIVNEDGIIEIQTRSFDRLRKKLDSYLQLSKVTIVYPIPYTKWLFWIEPSTGKITKKRKSPKQGKIYDVFFELYKIKQFLDNPNLRLCIIFIDIEEYRYLNGWSADKKKGSTRCDRIPIEIIRQVYINDISDYEIMIPPIIGDRFTSNDFKASTGLSLSNARLALNVLYHVKAVNRAGKTGNAFVYEKVQKRSK